MMPKIDQQKGLQLDSGKFLYCKVIDNEIYYQQSSLNKNGPWEKVLDETLEDSRNQVDPLPLQTFNFKPVIARYVKFKVVSWYQKGGGLQYFNMIKSGILTLVKCSKKN